MKKAEHSKFYLFGWCLCDRKHEGEQANWQTCSILLSDQGSTPDKNSLPIPHPVLHKTPIQQKLLLTKSCLLVLLYFLPFPSWRWLSCPLSVMAVYISENNKTEAVEPREGWSGSHVCPSTHPHDTSSYHFCWKAMGGGEEWWWSEWVEGETKAIVTI